MQQNRFKYNVKVKPMNKSRSHQPRINACVHNYARLFVFLYNCSSYFPNPSAAAERVGKKGNLWGGVTNEGPVGVVRRNRQSAPLFAYRLTYSVYSICQDSTVLDTRPVTRLCMGLRTRVESRRPFKFSPTPPAFGAPMGPNPFKFQKEV